MANINLYNQDCLEAMKAMKDNSYDLAITDPPYGINADQKHNDAALRRLKSKGKTKSGRGYKLYKQTDWDQETPSQEYFDELFRVSKAQIIWGGNYFDYLWQFSNSFIIWNKEQREFSLADGELAWYSKPNKAMRIFDMSRGAALSDGQNNGGRFHPTQKPVKLYRWLLKKYAKEGYKILDTHLGSGTISIACHIEGYDLDAFEIDTDYYEGALKRYNLLKNQLKLL